MVVCPGHFDRQDFAVIGGNVKRRSLELRPGSSKIRKGADLKDSLQGFSKSPLIELRCLR